MAVASGEDVDCILFKDENRATVVVSTVLQLLQPPLPLCVNAQTCEVVGSVRRESQRLMTTVMTGTSTMIIPFRSIPGPRVQRFGPASQPAPGGAVTPILQDAEPRWAAKATPTESLQKLL